MKGSTIRATLLATAVAAAAGAATPASAANQRAYYPFDANFDDASGNGKNGTPTDSSVVTINTATKRWGAGAADFANPLAGNAYVNLIANPIQFPTATPYAISFWARPTDDASSNTGGMILGDPATTNSFLWLEEGAGGVRLRSVTNANANFAIAATGAGGYKDGAFHHVVVQVSALDADNVVNDVSLWYDGVAKADVKNVANTSLDIRAIGQGYTTALNVSYKGQIDEVRVFDGPLTAGEVSSLYATNTVPEPTAAAAAAGLAAGGLLARRRGRRH